MKTITRLRQLMLYLCIVLVGSIALAALTTLLDMKDELWKRTTVNITHIIWGGILTWTWLWIIGYFKQPNIDDFNQRMIDMQRRLNETLERINQIPPEPPAEPRQVDIEL